MARKKHSPEQIVAILQQIEVEVATVSNNLVYNTSFSSVRSSRGPQINGHPPTTSPPGRPAVKRASPNKPTIATHGINKGGKPMIASPELRPEMIDELEKQLQDEVEKDDGVFAADVTSSHTAHGREGEGRDTILPVHASLRP